MEMLRVTNISKKYKNGDEEIFALKDINLSVRRGEFLAITGKSGSGKSTLLHVLAGLNRPNSGEVIINNQNIYNLSDKELTIFRRKNVGFIYQFYNLLPFLNIRENIILPSIFDKRKINYKRLNELIKTLELTDKVNYMPNDLSGGQQQRAAIGRALINKPRILFADEPTGNLDSKNSIRVMKLLEYYNKKYKQTIIMVTHDMSLARRCKRNVVIKDGKIISDYVK